MLDCKLLPTIHAAIHSMHWQSKVRHEIKLFDSTPLTHWHLAIEDAIGSLSLKEKAIVIAELPQRFAREPEDTLSIIAEACNNCLEGQIFILGDESCESWCSVLLEAGATESCFSMLDFGRFWSRICKCLIHQATLELSVEQAVAARLRS